ncbi:hypothetical protein ACWDBC_00765 [Streptomyces parvus]|uniref:hypothetical protein n=1 Tax=Streptomyces TaxID=1883 RepID=UPI001F4473E0|nr:hypothetical protein [Streptomyces sp. CS149]
MATGHEPDTRTDDENPGEHGGDKPGDPAPRAPTGRRGRGLRLVPAVRRGGRLGRIAVRRLGRLTVRTGLRLPRIPVHPGLWFVRSAEALLRR